MNHVFVIKDFLATEDSAKHIMKNQIDVILKASSDISITEVKVFVNNNNTDNYPEYAGSIPVVYIPTLVSGKKKTNTKQTFAAFHNSVINGIAGNLQAKNTLIHIQDGTLDLTDTPSDRGILKTRLGEMVNDVLYMMKLLDHPVWFNTASDKGNMKYGHYFTMIDFLNIDNNCLLDTLPDCIMYSGNSNLDWIMIDAEAYKEKKMPTLVMNGSYDYDFLYIKHLIAKFANYEHGYFDNMFPTVPTEVGSYFRNPNFDRDLQHYDMSKYKENMENYRKNLMEFKNLKQITINDVVLYVRSVLLDKLSDTDKEKLNNFVNSINLK